MLTSAVITVVQMVSVNIYFIVHVGNIARKKSRTKPTMT